MTRDTVHTGLLTLVFLMCSALTMFVVVTQAVQIGHLKYMRDTLDLRTAYFRAQAERQGIPADQIERIFGPRL